MIDLSDLIVGIELKLVRAGWLSVFRQGNRRVVKISEPRLEAWAITVLQLGSAENIALAVEHLAPERRWRFFRMRFPESALFALEGKADEFLKLESENALQKNQESLAR
jgi:hypothetical protein